MADPFVAEIRIFAFNFAPKGWAFCDGQILPISQNTALFSLLGTTYGGDGKSTFGLPRLQGRSAMQPRQGPGLSNYSLGQQGGTETVTLLSSEMPSHTHQLTGSEETGNENNAVNNLFGDGETMYGAAQNLSQMSQQALNPAGGDLPHNNMMPYLTLYFNIALQGVFPPRP